MKKKRFEEVKKVFEDIGYTLISTEYKNNKVPLDIICDKGHIGKIRLANFSSGQRCNICRGKKTIKIEEVEKEFEKEGYTLLSKTYKNAKQKLDVICPNGHKSSVTYINFHYHGKRCKKCYENSLYDTNKVKEILLKYGFELLSDYKNNYEPIYYKCTKGHINKKAFGNFLYYPNCKKCHYLDSRRKPEYIESIFNSYGYKLIRIFEESTEIMEIECPKGHRSNIHFCNFVKGHRCKYCNNSLQTSLPELEIYKTISNLVGKELVINRDSNLIKPFEIDIFIPHLKLAIEYCGLYWHGEVFSEKPVDYHYNKMMKCFEKKVRLITIFEDEFLNNKEIVFGRIKNALGIIEERIYARNCFICEISVKQAREFMEINHIQGSVPTLFRFGLFYNDRLLQVMTFGSLSRTHAGIKGMLELKRFASIPNISVVGGASKLFKHAILKIKEAGYTQVKSYCDMRYANIFNTVYEKLGFKLVGFTKYTPHYVKGQKRYRNQGLRKTPAERLTGKTEWELRREQGYDRIWDCGHRTYLYTV